MDNTRLVAKPILAARKRHVLAPSRISAPFIWLGRVLMPAYLRTALYFRKIEIRNPEQIVEAVRDFQEERTRLIVAFRHPYGDEPQLVFHVFENLIPRYAKKLHQPLKHQTNLRLVHDYAVPLWSNAIIRFLLPRAGAMPVYHVKCEPASLSNIRNVLKNGPCPLGLAPEGQISYHSETLPRIELGTIRMGFWCASDIAKAGRSERVLVLPISIHYEYDRRDIGKIKASIARMESICGLDSGKKAKSDLTLAMIPARMDAIEQRVLEIVEDYYKATYGYLPPDEPLPGETDSAARQRRWNALLPAALSVAENMLGIDPGEDDIVQRMYRVRLEGWNRVYPEDGLDTLTPLEAGLADRRAGEGWFAMRHMELVDLMSYHDTEYLLGGQAAEPSFDRIVECVLNLEDLVNRLLGGNISNRPNAIRKKAVLVPAPCLDLSARLADYRKNPKQAARDATSALAKRFENCIEEYHHETTC